jgi:hypothetical protein
VLHHFCRLRVSSMGAEGASVESVVGGEEERARGNVLRHTAAAKAADQGLAEKLCTLATPAVVTDRPGSDRPIDPTDATQGPRVGLWVY